MVCAPVRRDNPPSFNEGIIDCTGAQTMLYLACTTISSVDLAQYGVSLAKDWVSVECGTNFDGSIYFDQSMETALKLRPFSTESI